MIVVTTPTGFIGSKVVKELLSGNERVRVIARDPDKLAADVRGEIEVVRGSSDDAAVLDRALNGAESLFHVVPPLFSAPNVSALYRQFTLPVITAMQRHGVKRIVSVSALGRGSGVKAGPVSAALEKDIALEQAGLDVRALWCPGFMENILRSLEPLRTQGKFFWPSRSDLKNPLVATRDIAAVAARLLRDRGWSGPGGVAVLGPEDLSMDDKAAILSDVLARPIAYQRVPAEAFRAQLESHGASKDFAQGMIDMLAAKDAGLDHCVPRTPDNTTPTTFRSFCMDVVKPALR